MVRTSVINLLKDALTCTVTSSIVIAVWYSSMPARVAIGPIAILLGFVPIVAARLRGYPVKKIAADMVFGAIDTGFLTIVALIGASLFGIIGAIVGGDAITDMIAGFFE